MRCPDCGAKVLNAKAGYACGICGTLNADGHTLESFAATLTEDQKDQFWELACQNDDLPCSYDIWHLAQIMGRFGVNPYALDTCRWHLYEREWQENFPNKVRHQ